MESNIQPSYNEIVARLISDVNKLVKMNHDGIQMQSDITALSAMVRDREKNLNLMTGMDTELSGIFDHYHFGDPIDFDQIKETLEKTYSASGKIDKIRQITELLSFLPDDYHNKGRIVSNAQAKMEEIQRKAISKTINQAIAELDATIDSLQELNKMLGSETSQLEIKRKALETNLKTLQTYADRYGCKKSIEDAQNALDKSFQEVPSTAMVSLDLHITKTNEVISQFSSEKEQIETLKRTIAGKQVSTWSDRRSYFLNELTEIINSDPATSPTFDIVQYKTRARDLLVAKKNDINDYVNSNKGKARRYADVLDHLRDTDSSHIDFLDAQKAIAEKESERIKRIIFTTLKVLGFCVAIPVVVGYYILKFVFSIINSSSNNE